MSAVSFRGQERRTIEVGMDVQARMVGMVRRHGAGPRAIRIISDLGENIIDDLLSQGKAYSNPNAVDILKAAVQAMDLEISTYRAQLPWVVAFAIEWILFYPRFQAIRELKRIVEDL